jgi:methylenetetrahydrofolate reductase (NADPH)
LWPVRRNTEAESYRIITPTIIEAASFRAWRDEAFSIWRQWQRIYSPASETAALLHKVRTDYWLVNTVHHDYKDTGALWNLLLE